MKKMLIIYYSWSNGNTERIAKQLQKETGADLEKIDTILPYTGSYDEVVRQGQDEIRQGFQPEIQPLAAEIGDYDVIAIGIPTWWYTMAPGSIIVIPANVKHWHGAKADSWFSHIACEIPGEECSTEWCEAVTDEEYHRL